MPQIDLPPIVLPDQPELLVSLANRALWVCLLSPEGLESFVGATLNDEGTIRTNPANDLPKQPEVSTIRLFVDDAEVVVLPVAQHDDGTLICKTIDEIIDSGKLPTFTAESLARRIKMQPHRRDLLAPLLKLPVTDQTS